MALSTCGPRSGIMPQSSLCPMGFAPHVGATHLMPSLHPQRLAHVVSVPRWTSLMLLPLWDRHRPPLMHTLGCVCATLQGEPGCWSVVPGDPAWPSSLSPPNPHVLADCHPAWRCECGTSSDGSSPFPKLARALCLLCVHSTLPAAESPECLQASSVG